MSFKLLPLSGNLVNAKGNSNKTQSSTEERQFGITILYDYYKKAS